MKYFMLGLVSLLLLLSCGENKKGQKIATANHFLNYYLVHLIKDGSPTVIDSSDFDAERCFLANGKDWAKMGFNLKDPIEEKSLNLNLPVPSTVIPKADLPEPWEPNSWKIFQSKHGKGLYKIAVPVVNEACNRVIFSYSYFCGDRCGHGETLLFERTSSGWKLIRKYCDWGS